MLCGVQPLCSVMSVARALWSQTSVMMDFMIECDDGRRGHGLFVVLIYRAHGPRKVDSPALSDDAVQA